LQLASIKMLILTYICPDARLILHELCPLRKIPEFQRDGSSAYIVLSGGLTSAFVIQHSADGYAY